LTVSELVMRFFGYAQHFRHEEYLRLRAAFERALVGEPGHALGWACLAVLYEQEYSQLLNLSPEPLRRSAEAAQRSVELDPTSQRRRGLRAGIARGAGSAATSAGNTLSATSRPSRASCAR